MTQPPYAVKPFGNLGIPSDWRFYTPLAGRLANAGNEEALQDLVDIIARIRRTTFARYEGVLGAKEMPNMAGRIRNMRWTV